MALVDRPDFQVWLARFEAHYDRLHGTHPRPSPNRCDGCGEPIPEPISSTGLCLICLAEQYGRDRTRSAARIAGTLRTALAQNHDASLTDIRDAIEEVLADYDTR